MRDRKVPSIYRRFGVGRAVVELSFMLMMWRDSALISPNLLGWEAKLLKSAAVSGLKNVL